MLDHVCPFREPVPGVSGQRRRSCVLCPSATVSSGSGQLHPRDSQRYDACRQGFASLIQITWWLQRYLFTFGFTLCALLSSLEFYTNIILVSKCSWTSFSISLFLGKGHLGNHGDPKLTCMSNVIFICSLAQNDVYIIICLIK